MDDPVDLDFFGQLHWHLENGTRPGLGPGAKGVRWKRIEFAEACLGKNHEDLENAARTVRNWFNHKVRPSEGHYPLIEFSYFGRESHNDPYKDWRAAFKKAYDDVPLRGKSTYQPNNLPFHSLGNLFRGREVSLREIHDAFLGNSMARSALASKALHGLGGIGKTRLAIEYAWKRAEAYSALLFISAENPENLEWSLAALAKHFALDLPDSDKLGDRARLKSVIRWLANNPVWLLIVDNVDDERAMTAVARLLSPLRGGHILLTGRWSTYPASISKYELEKLAIEDATSFLIDRTSGGRRRSQDDDVQALALATKLDGLALALEQAAAYIDAQRIGFDTYLKRWDESRSKLLDWYSKDLVSYNHDVGLGATFATSIVRLTLKGRHLLESAVFFDTGEPLPETILHAIFDRTDHDPRAALAELFSYSLATPSQISETGEAGFSIHRHVLDFVRRRMDSEHAKTVLLGVLELFSDLYSGPQTDREAELFSLRFHAVVLLSEAYKNEVMVAAMPLFFLVGQFLHANGIWKVAATLLSISLNLHLETYGAEAPIVEEGIYRLALLCADSYRLKDADELSQRALTYCESKNESGDEADIEKLVSRLVLRARILQEMDNRDEAELLLLRALKISEDKLGFDHSVTGEILNQYAALLSDDKRLEKAHELLNRSLAIDEASDTDSNPVVASKLENLARLYCRMGRVAESVPLLRRARAVQTNCYRDGDPRTGPCIVFLARVLHRLGQLAEAEVLYRQGVALLGWRSDDHPDFAAAMAGFAFLLYETGRYNEAAPAYEVVVDVYGQQNQLTGRLGPQLETAMNNFAATLAKMGHTTEEIFAKIDGFFEDDA
jgi:hypothetical protein